MNPKEMAQYIDAVSDELRKLNDAKIAQKNKEWDEKTKAGRSQRCTWRDIWRGIWSVPNHG